MKGIAASFIGMFVMACSGCGGSGNGTPAVPTQAAVPAAPKLLDPFLPALFNKPEMKAGPDLQFDANGIPKPRIWSTGTLEYNSTVVAQWGLAAEKRYVETKDEAARVQMLKAANWLISKQMPNGGFALGFDLHHPDPRGFQMNAPWFSAITQGNSISLLVRIYGLTGDARYRDAAEKALDIYAVPVASGGLQGTMNGSLWYEETPDPKYPNHIFNGFIFALLGIHDFYQATGSQKAFALWSAGENSLRKNMDAFVVKSAPEDATLPMPWSVYDMQVNGFPETPNYLTDQYMGFHIILLRELYARTGYAKYKDLADQWDVSLVAYLENHPKTP